MRVGLLAFAMSVLLAACVADQDKSDPVTASASSPVSDEAVRSFLGTWNVSLSGTCGGCRQQEVQGSTTMLLEEKGGAIVGSILWGGNRVPATIAAHDDVLTLRFRVSGPTRPRLVTFVLERIRSGSGVLRGTYSETFLEDPNTGWQGPARAVVRR